MKTSASALDTADITHGGCLRKWWFKHLKHVPTPPTGSTIFGDVLHAVAERYLEADENGLKGGQPVNLYPDGWESPFNRFSGERSSEALSMEEQSLVKLLIEAAISEGVLMRVEGRQIERQIDFVPFENVQVTGFIDLLEPEAIRDHKTTKSMKWAKSVKPDAKESLYTNIQLMLYAYWYFTEGGYDKLNPLALSHQYYVKDFKAPRVEKREIKVTWQEVEKFFKEKICPIMELMLAFEDAKKWQDVPLPPDVAEACRKFGGCPYVKICTEQETVEEFTRKVERQLGKNNKTAGDSKNKGDQTMTKLEEIKARMAAEKAAAAGQPAAAPTPAPAPAAQTPAPTPAAAPAPAASDGGQTAPWYKEGCKSCTTNPIKGMNSAGTAPCKVCEVWAKKDGLPLPTDFKWSVAAGKLIVHDDKGTEVLEAPVVTEPVKVKEVVKPVVKAEPPEQPEQAPAVALAVEKPAVEAPEHQETAVVFGNIDFLNDREKFQLLIGCAVVETKAKGAYKLGSSNCRVTAEELLLIVQDEMQKIVGTVRWGQMSNFDKRDAVAAFGKNIGEALGASTVVVSRMPKASLLEAIISAIRPYAREVIQALAE